MNSQARVAIVDGERLERLRPFLGALGANLIATRANQLYGATSWTECTDDAVDDLPMADIEPEDDATIFYTSGTTGRPKGALGSHRNIITNQFNTEFSVALTALRRDGVLPAAVDEQKTTLLPVPLFHVTGCHSTLFPSLATGRRIVLMHRWNPERALELIGHERVNFTVSVPSMVWQLLESPNFARSDLSTIEGISYGGAAAAPDLARRIAQRFPALLPRQGYGATETSSVVSSNSGADYQHRPDSVGLPAPACDVQITSPDGMAVAVGSHGEIWVRGPNVVKGYWRNPEATADAFVEGWYRTGDVGRVDEDGFIYIMDRIKDMLIRGGENIYCVEIEAALFAHAAVMDAAVFGIPDLALGEEVAAVVRIKPDHKTSEAELRAHVGRLLATHKVPKKIQVRHDELPKNANGKTLKRVLREQLST
jgi:long-chain acyl-CoA synthetase